MTITCIYLMYDLMKYIVGGEQSGDFLYFSTAPELPRTRVRQRERTDLPNLLSSESHHQQSASQERLMHMCMLDDSMNRLSLSIAID